MKLSFDWLGDFVDLTGISPEQLAEKLTMGAFEVEEITVFGADLVGPLVVGEIMEIRQHPNADKIRITKTRVKDGEEPLEIVCGAQNIEVGQRIPVALPGAKVINRKDGSALHIKASAIRGVHSNGMLCSPPEIGLDMGEGTSEGILILNGPKSPLKEVPQLGEDVATLLGLKPDYILHVEPRSNRGDALSVQGLAREVAALFNRPLKNPAWSLDELGGAGGAGFKVWRETGKQTSNQDDCPFFTLQTIENVKIAPAPPFITKRLEAIGLRPVNNVVDITNYVMHELGQPLHAYDKDRIKHGALGIRRAVDGEKITTIDGRERSLTSEMLVIVDGENLESRGADATIVGVAGVMGGLDSEVSENTTSLLLEAACFGQAVVRRASRLLGLSSDASLRFERGVDVASVLNAGKRAAYLISKYCTTEGAAKVPALTTDGSDNVSEISVELRLPQIKRILGIEIGEEKVKSLLTPLGFSVKNSGAQKLVVGVPSFRQTDVYREIDLIEEVCRLNGYDQIPATMPSATFAREAPSDTLSLVRSTLCAQGLSEAWLSSLVSGSTPGLVPDHLVAVLNPLSKDHEALRQSLAPGLLTAAAYNQDHGAKQVWLFEHGRAYLQDKNSATGTGVNENTRLAGIVLGEKVKGQTVDYYFAKGLVENVFECLGIESRKYQFLSPDQNLMAAHLPWLHPYRSALVALNRPAKKSADAAKSIWDSNIVLGYVGQIHPKYQDEAGLRQEGFIFELDLQKLSVERKARKFSEISTAPSIVRDLTADFAPDHKPVTHQEILTTIGKKAGANIRQIELVSLFESDKEAGKLSLSYRLTFQHPSETLTGEEIDKVMAAVRESLTSDLGASFRL